MGYDPLYLRGVELFNQKRFFEAHEAWEALWHRTEGPAAEFLQGLIQAAVAFHHLRNGNQNGARYLYEAGRGRLQPCGSSFWGLDVGSFLAAFDACFAPPKSGGKPEPGIPLLRLVPD